MTAAANNSVSEAKRIEELVSNALRATRDEKIRLDTQIDEQRKQLDKVEAQLRRIAEDRDYHQRRAIQLETDLRALIAILTDALNKRPDQPAMSPDDGEAAPAFLTRARGGD